MSIELDQQETAIALRFDWTVEELRDIYNLPLNELLFEAQRIHRMFHDPTKIQKCTLLSIKTGRCPENCGYCPQSAHHDAEVDDHGLLDVDGVLAAAKEAKEAGSSRFCMGASWRDAPKNDQFDQVLEMVRGVKDLGMEACCTLGMLTDDQAKDLAEAGLTSYNHNLDTSEEYYDKVVTTRSYQERLDTLQRVRESGVSLCTGGIIGMGESIDDRMSMLVTLAEHDPHPESVPINMLLAMPGTPMADLPPVDSFEMVRMIATARIAMPNSRVRFAAGRVELSHETQALCFMAGANSIFTGDKLLTTPNPNENQDEVLLSKCGLQGEA
jgi:biotin synthase